MKENDGNNVLLYIHLAGFPNRDLQNVTDQYLNEKNRDIRKISNPFILKKVIFQSNMRKSPFLSANKENYRWINNFLVIWNYRKTVE